MPITIQGSTNARVGSVSATIGGFSTAFDGTIADPADRAGSTNMTLGGFGFAFDGQFGTSASFDGAIDATMSGFDVTIRQALSHTDLTPPSGIDQNDNLVFTNGGWSTTFDYSQACYHGGNGGTDCNFIADDGVRWNNGVANDLGGFYNQVIASADNPNGSGGFGSRHWVGDGSNQNSRAPLLCTLGTRETEFWLRWYVRYQSGFQWSGGGEPIYDKFLYMRFGANTIHQGGGSSMELIPGFNAGAMGIFIQGGGTSNQLQPAGTTWTDVFGNPADGNWHMMEIYVKMDTDSTDGVGRMWIDGTLIVEKTDVDYSAGDSDTRLGLSWFDFHNNQSSPANGQVMYVDYDDMCMYLSDPGNRDAAGNPWIGPINGFSGGA